jgi:hypothetical protein
MYSSLLSQGVHKIDSRIITIRSKYWSRFINYKESVLANLRWYINVVFICEGVFVQVMLLTYKIFNHNML